MNLPENYIVICETQNETNKVIDFIEFDNTKTWQFWNYVTVSKDQWNIYAAKKYAKEWFKNKNISDYKTFTFKEWKEMKENKTPPKYWFIKVKEETLDSINKVRAKQKENNEPIKTSDYDYYGKSKKYCPFGGLSLETVQEENLLELTLEEFKYYFLEEEFREHVLKHPNKLKPYKENSEVTYEMITTHPYFKTLSEKELFEIIGNGSTKLYNKLEGNWAKDKAEILFNKLNNKSMQKLIVPITDVLEIHKIACSSWKTKLVKYLERTDSNQNVSFTQIEINEMFDAATSDQKPVLERIFGEPVKTIKWDKIKTGSKVILNQDTSQRIGENNNVDYDKPFDVVFWKTPHSINCENTFRKTAYYESVSTFHQNEKYIRFDAGVHIDYIKEVIEY